MLENMLDYVRIALYTVLFALCFMLYQTWEKEHPSVEPTAPAVQTTNTAPPSFATTEGTATLTANPATAAAPTAPVATAPVITPGQIVKVTTDLLAVDIDTHGGNITKVELLNYPESLGAKTPYLLLNNDPKTRYVAESGLLSKEGPDTTQGQAIFTAPQLSYALAPGERELTVKLNWQKEGLSVEKVFVFTRDSYEVKVGYDIVNQSPAPWQGSVYQQLMRTDNPPPNQGGMINLSTYFGAAISTPKKPFEKISFKDIRDQKVANQTVKDGWAAMIQHYFIGAWVPAKDMVSHYYAQQMPNNLYSVGMISQPFTVAPGAKLTTQAKLYTGPAIADQLEQTAPGLKLTIDYGWFWFISGIIFWMMQKIYDVIGNWGWSIVLVTIIIKALFYQLSAKSYRSMSSMKKLQPKIEMLKERYADDKQKMTQATLELYREEKVNPMSGCLPILIQIPVFIALYWVLVESVQLRQAPFIFWIHDLSQQDPYYIMPILVGISMFIQQRLNPPPPDPMQAKVMMLMPVIFTALFINFPSGLMLYWFVNNTLSFLQQWYVMKKLDKETVKVKSKK